MTTEQVDETFISALEEMADVSNVDYRANVAPGTVLGQEEFGTGGMATYTKPNSMVKMGGKQMPDRLMLWNTVTGRGALVPTPVAMKRKMEGTKQFPATAFTFRDPHVIPPDPIPETCWICDERRAKMIPPEPPRRFYDIVQYETHMEIKHTRAWRNRQRTVEHDERVEDREQMREMIREIVMAVRPDITLGEAEETGAGLSCPDCGAIAKSKAGLASHMRSHADE